MAVKVQVFRLPKLTATGHIAFHTESKLFMDDCGAENISCVDEMLLYDAAMAAEIAAVKRQRGSTLTADLDAIDKQRDKLLIYLFETLKAAKNSPMDAAQEAHKQLSIVMKPYHGIAYYTHTQETGGILAMLDDLRVERHAAHIAALNFTPAMDMLESRNNEYIQLDKQRINEMPSKMETDTLRKSLDTHYLLIVDRINATVVMTPNEPAKKLVERLNNYIHQINAAYNIRTSGHAKNDQAATKDTAV